MKQPYEPPQVIDIRPTQGHFAPPWAQDVYYRFLYLLPDDPHLAALFAPLRARVALENAGQPRQERLL